MDTTPATTPVKSSDTRAGTARRAFFFLGGVFIVYGIVGAFILPPIAKKVIASQVEEKLGRAVQIDKVTVNPYTLEATVEGVRMLEADRKTPFVSLARIDANGSITSLTRFAPVVDELTLDGLKVRLVRDGENHYNFSDLLAKLAAQPKQQKDDDPARFSVSNIRIANSQVDFDDRPVGATHHVTDIDVAIPFISNLPRNLKKFVQPRFSASVNGSPIHIRGETLPFEDSLKTHIALQVDQFDLPRYVGYSPTPLPVKLDAGKLGGRIEVRFTQASKAEPTVEVSGNLSLSDLAVSTPERQLARIALVRADGIHMNLLAKEVKVESLTTSGGNIALQRRADGSLALPVMEAASTAQARAEKPWRATLAKLTLDDYKLALADESVKPAISHQAALVHAEAANLSTDTSVHPNVSARLTLDKGGSVEVNSDIALDPLVIEAKVDARNIDLVPLRPYVDYFKTVKVKSALASAKGSVQLRADKGLKVAYVGSAEVSRFATFDTTIKEDLLNWDRVRAERVAFKWAKDEPLNLGVGDIDVVKAYSRVVVTPEGKINLQQLKFATDENPAPEPEPKENLKPRNVRIDRIRFVDSRLNFTDHFIKPNYTADVGELNGTVTGLSSAPEARAKVDLKGSYDKSSPVLIAGTVNPLSGDLFLDIAAKGNEIELPQLSAYSLRYAGYPITKGKLTLDVKYHVEDGKLDGRNKILLDQLTFGDKVENPEATKLPVLFAVNLLKDENGRIDLELPIKGSLEDPQFDMGALIGQVVSNLLKKALTAPFSLLAAAFGGGGGGSDGAKPDAGQDLQFVDFAPGSAEAVEAERAKLERITKAMLSRPAIRIEMAAHTDPEDLAALQNEYKGPVEPQALDALAARRAEWVKGYLTAEGRLPAERVLVASSDAGTVSTKVSRVDFTLK